MNHYRLIDVRFVDLTGDSDGGCDYTISVLHSDHPLVRFYDESGLKDGIWIKGYYGREEFQNHMDSVEEPEERDDYDTIMSLSKQQQDLYWEIANGVERGRITTELALLAGSVIVLDPQPSNHIRNVLHVPLCELRFGARNLQVGGGCCRCTASRIRAIHKGQRLHH